MLFGKDSFFVKLGHFIILGNIVHNYSETVYSFVVYIYSFVTFVFKILFTDWVLLLFFFFVPNISVKLFLLRLLFCSLPKTSPIGW